MINSEEDTESLLIKELKSRSDQLDQILDAILDCDPVEMRNCYEVKKEQWERLIDLVPEDLLQNTAQEEWLNHYLSPITGVSENEQ